LNSRTNHKFTLILVHTPLRQDISDFLTVRNMMRGYAPDIQTFVISVGSDIPVEVVQASRQRPCLVFSPMPVNLPNAIGGRRLFPPARTTKQEEMQLLEAAGFPVPKTHLLLPGSRPEKLAIGPLCIVKPNSGMQGKDVRLVRVDKLEKCLAAWAPDEASGLVVQEWIDTGAHAASYRVLTVLGEAIYCIKSTATATLPRPEQVPDEGVLASSNGQSREIRCAFDQDVLKLAQSIHKTLEFTPVMGIDIVREESSKRLVVLELNAAGWTWHLSSKYFKEYQKQFALDLYNQFGALLVLRNALVRKTRELAA
jgi:hypothetical protein